MYNAPILKIFTFLHIEEDWEILHRQSAEILHSSFHL
jgi:hypothetical protein